eukprot:2232354-Ditylum_brightwellii.AAC.1
MFLARVRLRAPGGRDHCEKERKAESVMRRKQQQKIEIITLRKHRHGCVVTKKRERRMYLMWKGGVWSSATGASLYFAKGTGVHNNYYTSTMLHIRTAGAKSCMLVVSFLA